MKSSICGYYTKKIEYHSIIRNKSNQVTYKDFAVQKQIPTHFHDVIPMTMIFNFNKNIRISSSILNSTFFTRLD